MKTVLFLGGTGQISRPCVVEAVAAGHRVTVLTRGQRNEAMPDGVEAVVGDMAAADGYAGVAGRRFDVVCQFQAFTTDQVARDFAALGGRIGQYVFISSASVYQKPPQHPVITEETPLGNPYSPYAKNKIDCEAMLRGQSAVPWTIVRPSHTLRTNLPTMVNEGDVVGRRLLRGKPVLVAGDGTTAWTITRAADFAVPFVRLFGNAGAVGEAFHITSHSTYSWNQVYGTIGRALGVEARIVHVPSEVLVRYNPAWQRHLFGDKTWNAMFDNSKVRRVVGDFTCAEDLHTLIEEPIAHFMRRRAGVQSVTDDLDPLIDRIADDMSRLAG